MSNLSKWLAVIGIVLLLALGGVAGWFAKRCPTIKAGVETTLVTVTVHDTVWNLKPAAAITVARTVRTVPAPVDTQRADSARAKDSTRTDTTVCYSFDEKEKDGTYIKAEMCSDSLPEEKPLDLTGRITYVAHPDTDVQTIRVDTLIREKKVPPQRDWKTYAMIVLASLAGGLAIAVAAGR